MTNERHNEPYAELAPIYDVIYSARHQTAQEVNFLKWAFKNLCASTIKTVLDVGCGTGRHAIPLSEDGFEVTGIDASEAMLRIAKRKAREAGVNPRFLNLDLRTLEIDRQFDAALCMLTVFNHLVAQSEVEAGLSNLKKCLRAGGLLVLDMINLGSLLRRYKDVDHQLIQDKSIIVHRIVLREFDELNLIQTHREFDIVTDGDHKSLVMSERKLRLYGYAELKALLHTRGFKRVCCFGSFEERTQATASAPRLIVVATRDSGD